VEAANDKSAMGQPHQEHYCKTPVSLTDTHCWDGPAIFLGCDTGEEAEVRDTWQEFGSVVDRGQGKEALEFFDLQRMAVRIIAAAEEQEDSERALAMLGGVDGARDLLEASLLVAIEQNRLSGMLNTGEKIQQPETVSVDGNEALLTFDNGDTVAMVRGDDDRWRITWLSALDEEASS